MMTDKEIINALIERDDRVTEDFFFRKCRPLFLSIIGKVYSYPVDYDECINDLYVYLMENDSMRLRQFLGRSSIFLWLKIVATRYFIKKRDDMIENTSKEPLYEGQQLATNPSDAQDAGMDACSLLGKMRNQRYAYALRRLLIDEADFETVASEMQVTTDNLYNIKKRALAALTQMALKDIKLYARK